MVKLSRVAVLFCFDLWEKKFCPSTQGNSLLSVEILKHDKNNHDPPIKKTKTLRKLRNTEAAVGGGGPCFSYLRPGVTERLKVWVKRRSVRTK